MKQGINTMDGIGQRHAMGMGGDMAAGNFGVKPIDCCDGKSMGPPTASKLGDGERMPPASGGRGKMAKPGEVDHGRHR